MPLKYSTLFIIDKIQKLKLQKLASSVKQKLLSIIIINSNRKKLPQNAQVNKALLEWFTNLRDEKI